MGPGRLQPWQDVAGGPTAMAVRHGSIPCQAQVCSSCHTEPTRVQAAGHLEVQGLWLGGHLPTVVLLRP